MSKKKEGTYDVYTQTMEIINGLGIFSVPTFIVEALAENVKTIHNKRSEIYDIELEDFYIKTKKNLYD